jgi:D-inositol-3-phosphate glycosyltransferase
VKSKIAFISEHASPLALLGGVDSGGQNVYVDQVAKHLAKLGYEVDIFTRWDNPLQKQIVSYAPGIRVIHVPAGPKEFIVKEKLFPLMNDFAANMIAFIRGRNIDYDIIHAHFWMSGYVASLIKKILGIPYVITFHALGKVRRMHQGTADGFPDSRFEIEETVAKEADMVIAECPQDKEDLMILYYMREEKIKVIPCGFDQTEFFPINKRKAKQMLGLNPKEKVILQLGRMVPRKGVDNVIKSLSVLLQKKEIPVRLLLVGGESEDPCPIKTPEIGRLMKIAKEANVLDNVTFVGRKTRDQLKYYYNAADVFVSTPWYEPFGITPLEAMACGTPVIGSNVGGIKFSVLHGKTGFLVPANEPEILAQRMLQILDDKAVAKAFNAQAIQHVNGMFTWETVTLAMAELYESVMRKSGRSVDKIGALFEPLGTLRTGNSKSMKLKSLEGKMISTNPLL